MKEDYVTKRRDETGSLRKKKKMLFFQVLRKKEIRTTKRQQKLKMQKMEHFATAERCYGLLYKKNQTHWGRIHGAPKAKVRGGESERRPSSAPRLFSLALLVERSLWCKRVNEPVTSANTPMFFSIGFPLRSKTNVWGTGDTLDSIVGRSNVNCGCSKLSSSSPENTTTQTWNKAKEWKWERRKTTQTSWLENHRRKLTSHLGCCRRVCRERVWSEMLTEENLADFVDRRLNPHVRARRCARSSRGEIGGDSGRRGCELPFRQRHLKRRVKHRERKRKKQRTKIVCKMYKGL